jgi:hypothetical protein
MDLEMEDIIKNIIRLNQKATELRNHLDEELQNRKKKVEQQIQQLESEILSKAKSTAERKKESALHEVKNEAEAIINEGKMRADQRIQSFRKNKGTVIRDIFYEII